MLRLSLSILLLLAALFPVHGAEEAEDIYQAPEAFLAESFEGEPPAPAVLWLTKPMREEIKRILGHDFAAMRVRHWSQGSRSAWILDEIGKVKPITAGIVVADRRIERLKVLVYRESHGWEVKQAFFTERFHDASRSAEGALDRSIDNISGATLSVNALKRMAALALYLDTLVRPEPVP